MIKDIPGFEGRYGVTEDGKVWSHPKTWVLPKGGIRGHDGKWLKPFLRGKGNRQYKAVEFNGGQAYSVHRLVAITFIDNPSQLPMINHMDGDRLNNSVNNLEWCDQKHNSRHAQDNGLNVQRYGMEHGGHKLSTLAVIEMRRKRSRGAKIVDLAEEFKCSKSNVSYICRGETRIYG